MSDDLAFNPGEIKATVGERVRLAIENRGTALHDLTIESIEVEEVETEGGESSGGHGGDNPAYDLHLALNGGTSGRLEFIPMEEGEYEFTCTETGHAEGGMTGTLVVAE